MQTEDCVITLPTDRGKFFVFDYGNGKKEFCYAYEDNRVLWDTGLRGRGSFFIEPRDPENPHIREVTEDEVPVEIIMKLRENYEELRQRKEI